MHIGGVASERDCVCNLISRLVLKYMRGQTYIKPYFRAYGHINLLNKSAQGANLLKCTTGLTKDLNGFSREGVGGKDRS